VPAPTAPYAREPVRADADAIPLTIFREMAPPATGATMAEIDDRLVPENNLSNCDICFSRMTALTDGIAEFEFRISVGDKSLHIPVIVPPQNQGLDHMMVDAHDVMIDILRQLLYRVDKQRSYYENRLAQLRQPANGSE
jgi:hypothetical protein